MTEPKITITEEDRRAAWKSEYGGTMGEIGGKYLASVAKLRKVE